MIGFEPVLICLEFVASSWNFISMFVYLIFIFGLLWKVIKA